MKQLKDLLEKQGKHVKYQLFPPKILEMYPELKTLEISKPIRLDNKRFKYITRSIDFNNKEIIDIGANTGYFSFRLITEFQCKVHVYEPFEPHIKVITETAALLNLGENELTVKNEGVTLQNIKNLPEVDVILLFNVLQHAGEDFDKHIVTDVSKWKDYAIEYLTRLRKKSNYLVFQLGYSWLGNDQDLCSESNILDFSKDILTKAGWEIDNIGLITNYSSQLFEDLKPIDISKHPLLSTMKNVEYGIKYRLGFNMPNFRFIKRPLYICKS